MILTTILIALMGLFGVTRLQTELIPDLEFPVLTVITTYPGAPPEAVDTDITTPVETAIRTLPGLDTVQATSSEGFSVVIAQFDYGTDMKDREQAALAAVNGLSLPANAGRPDIRRINLN